MVICEDEAFIVQKQQSFALSNESNSVPRMPNQEQDFQKTTSSNRNLIRYQEMSVPGVFVPGKNCRCVKCMRTKNISFDQIAPHL